MMWYYEVILNSFVQNAAQGAMKVIENDNWWCHPSDICKYTVHLTFQAPATEKIWTTTTTKNKNGGPHKCYFYFFDFSQSKFEYCIFFCCFHALHYHFSPHIHFECLGSGGDCSIVASANAQGPLVRWMHRYLSATT